MAARSDIAHSTGWTNGRVASWFVTADHKRIGIMYIATAIFFFAFAVLLALLMPQNSDSEFMTMYGTMMIFLVVVPIMVGFGTFLVPLMIGARDIAFPRLNALAYWLFLLGGLVLSLSWFSKGGAAHAGLWSDPTVSEASPGNGQDYWILAILMLALSLVFAAINFIVTIHNMRTAGMTWTRMPLFVRAMEAYAILLLIALPAMAAAVTLLLLDRRAGTHFFIPGEGGSGVLYQHLFWFFGHPAVYLLVLPALGMIGEILGVFSRKPIFGHKAIALATLALALFSLLVWVRHMFRTGLGTGLESFFIVGSMVIAIPTGLKIVGWLVTTRRRNLVFDSPMLFALGFLALFTIGGLSGFVLAVVHVDWSLNDIYNVAAHFRYIGFGGIAFALFAGIHYWWPKMFGRMLDESLAKSQFWLMFIGFNINFLPLHVFDVLGMPGRVDTDHHSGLWTAYSWISAVGGVLTAIGALLFVANIWITHGLRKGVRVGNDPWLADTLEWYTTSPPPAHNFDSVPYVTSARPLRDVRRRLAEEGT